MKHPLQQHVSVWHMAHEEWRSLLVEVLFQLYHFSELWIIITFPKLEAGRGIATPSLEEVAFFLGQLLSHLITLTKLMKATTRMVCWKGIVVYSGLPETRHGCCCCCCSLLVFGYFRPLSVCCSKTGYLNVRKTHIFHRYASQVVGFEIAYWSLRFVFFFCFVSGGSRVCFFFQMFQPFQMGWDSFRKPINLHPLIFFGGWIYLACLFLKYYCFELYRVGGRRMRDIWFSDDSSWWSRWHVKLFFKHGSQNRLPRHQTSHPCYVFLNKTSFPPNMISKCERVSPNQ